MDYRMIITTTKNETSKMYFNHIADAREVAVKTFEEENVKSVVIATKKGKAKWYQNKVRPVEVWIN
jgi:hypothetical protein